MARRLHNWSYRELIGFLKKNGFTLFKELGGSHQAWIKRGEDGNSDKTVGLHFTRGTYSIGAMKRMIRDSGIEEKLWIKR